VSTQVQPPVPKKKGRKNSKKEGKAIQKVAEGRRRNDGKNIPGKLTLSKRTENLKLSNF
jgi:hypothetical protein